MSQRYSLDGACHSGNRGIWNRRTAFSYSNLKLRAALESVGQIIGTADTEEILGEIFGRFCIGK
jgi:tRNA U34 5-carboxymethylaminomethyl modifying GTPase MnmE/TrmE